MRTRLPKEWPILEASDIHKGALSGPDNTHCLIGWALKATGCEGYMMMPSVRNALERSCGCENIAHNNDRDTKENNARKWNRAGYLLGYTVGNPESKPLPWEKKR